MELTKTRFGETGSGEAVYQYTLKENGGEVQILDYGCTLRSIRVPDRTGQAVDVCLGYDTVAEYESHDGYLGAVIGRHANRIQAGRFSLGGKEYHLACNDGPNTSTAAGGALTNMSGRRRRSPTACASGIPSRTGTRDIRASWRSACGTPGRRGAGFGCTMRR